MGAHAIRRVVERIDYPTIPQSVRGLTITPTTAAVVVNEGLQFTCMATFLDYTTADVTPYVGWRDVANDEDITENGLYSNTRTGVAIIRASLGTLSSNSVAVTDLPGGKPTTGNLRATVQLMGTRSATTTGTIRYNSKPDWSGTTYTPGTVSVPTGTNATSNTGSWNPLRGSHDFKAEAASYITHQRIDACTSWRAPVRDRRSPAAGRRRTRRARTRATRRAAGGRPS